MQENLMGMLPIIVICFIFYFLVVRPQEKKKKELQDKITKLKRGDRIMTVGGIYGSVDEVKDATILVLISKNTVIEVNKAHIVEA